LHAAASRSCVHGFVLHFALTITIDALLARLAPDSLSFLASTLREGVNFETARGGISPVSRAFLREAELGRSIVYRTFDREGEAGTKPHEAMPRVPLQDLAIVRAICLPPGVPRSQIIREWRANVSSGINAGASSSFLSVLCDLFRWHIPGLRCHSAGTLISRNISPPSPKTALTLAFFTSRPCSNCNLIKPARTRELSRLQLAGRAATGSPASRRRVSQLPNDNFN